MVWGTRQKCWMTGFVSPSQGFIYAVRVFFLPHLPGFQSLNDKKIARWFTAYRINSCIFFENE